MEKRRLREREKEDAKAGECVWTCVCLGEEGESFLIFNPLKRMCGDPDLYFRVRSVPVNPFPFKKKKNILSTLIRYWFTFAFLILLDGFSRFTNTSVKVSFIFRYDRNCNKGTCRDVRNENNSRTRTHTKHNNNTTKKQKSKVILRSGRPCPSPPLAGSTSRPQRSRHTSSSAQLSR